MHEAKFKFVSIDGSSIKQKIKRKPESQAVPFACLKVYVMAADAGSAAKLVVAKSVKTFCNVLGDSIVGMGYVLNA